MEFCAGRRKPAVHEGEFVELLPEDTALMKHPTVTTITFYEGQAPAQLMRDRASAVVKANPWLAGRLVTTSDGVKLLIPVPIKDDACFVELSCADLGPDSSTDAILDKVGSAIVKTGNESLDVDKPQFMVILVSTQPAKFAVVVSLSHVIADGYTYYCLYNALGKDVGDIAADATLNPVRAKDFGAALSKTIGQDKIAWKTSPSMMLGIVRKLIFRTPAFKVRAFYVNEEWVEAQKKVHEKSTEIPFVSTNDVLTSWFLKRGGYDYAMMMVNFRKRLCGLTETHAGNYEGEIHLWPEMFQTAGDIRRPLVNNFCTGRDDAPGVSTNLASNIAVVSNWAGFGAELKLPGCQQVIHKPVFVTKGIMDGCIIFKPTSDKLAVLIIDRPASDGPETDPALGQQIF
mmetsp:Transcript_83248/g.269468  ORF Transcript_83248/g.269468 Transcript_83248/m.269468 type:complete len:401 (+) Transcript_83248:74-1276(+)